MKPAPTLFSGFWLALAQPEADPSFGGIASLAGMTKNRQRIVRPRTMAVAVAFNRVFAVDGKFFCVLIAESKGAVVK